MTMPVATRRSVEQRRAGAATVIVTLPPPTTGMTRVNERVVSELCARGDVKVFNLGRGGAGRRRAWKAIRSFRQLWASLRVLAGRAGEGKIYIALNSGGAVALDVVLVAAARLRGRRVYVHHHSFRFLDQPAWLLRALYRAGGDAVVDVALCETMAERLRRAYGRADVRVVPNSADVATAEPGVANRREDVVVLGHLSNLSLEKGAGRTIEAFERARAAGLPVELHLAGPCLDEATRSVVEEACNAYPGDVFYHGPLYGPEKDCFYASLDLFLYPTAYAVEAQPLVLLEALGAGVPVVTVDRGCIRELTLSAMGASVTVATLAEFADAVQDAVVQLQGSGGRATAHMNAVETANAFAFRARSALESLVDEVLDSGA